MKRRQAFLMGPVCTTLLMGWAWRVAGEPLETVARLFKGPFTAMKVTPVASQKGRVNAPSC